MAIATSVSPPGRGGLPCRDLQPTLWHSRLYFYPFFVISSSKSCVLSLLFSFSLSFPVPPSRSGLAPPPLSLSSFFILAVARRRRGGVTPVLSALFWVGTDGPWWLAGKKEFSGKDQAAHGKWTAKEVQL